MNEYEYDVHGAPVVYTNRAPEPYNPLNRPNISFKKPIFTILTSILLNIVIIVAYNHYKSILEQYALTSKYMAIILLISVNIIFVSIFAKRTIIWLIHVYQRYAPDEVRLKCVFEPSCSEYMIIAIEKYGLLKGVLKGTDRLLRCHPPNGGCDEP